MTSSLQAAARARAINASCYALTTSSNTRSCNPPLTRLTVPFMSHSIARAAQTAAHGHTYRSMDIAS